MLLGCFWGMVWELVIDISILIVVVSLFFYVMFVRDHLQKQLNHNHEDLGHTLVQVVEQFSSAVNNQTQGTFKDAKQMMTLRMEELKFMMLEKVASFASNKFLKGDVGVHQIMPPAESENPESGNLVNKPDDPTA